MPDSYRISLSSRGLDRIRRRSEERGDRAGSLRTRMAEAGVKVNRALSRLERIEDALKRMVWVATLARDSLPTDLGERARLCSQFNQLRREIDRHCLDAEAGGTNLIRSFPDTVTVTLPLASGGVLQVLMIEGRACDPVSLGLEPASALGGSPYAPLTDDGWIPPADYSRPTQMAIAQAMSALRRVHLVMVEFRRAVAAMEDRVTAVLSFSGALPKGAHAALVLTMTREGALGLSERTGRDLRDTPMVIAPSSGPSLLNLSL